MTTRDAGHPASVLELASRLLSDLGRLVHQRLELLRAELARDAADLAWSAGALGAAAIGASVGLALLLVALGLWVGQLIGSMPGGLALVGIGLVVAGAGLGVVAVKRLERLRLARDTVRELRRDAEWIRHGV